MNLNLFHRVLLYTAALTFTFLTGCDNGIQTNEQLRSSLEKRIAVEHENRGRYAVLFRGFDIKSPKHDILHAHNTLMSLGFNEENIFILSDAYIRRKEDSMAINAMPAKRIWVLL